MRQARSHENQGSAAARQVAVALFCMSVVPQALAADVTIVAVPESRVAPKDVFEVGKLVWKCDGATCATVAPDKAIDAASCHNLAQKIGRIGYFGDQDKKQPLPPPQLEYCNKGIAASGPSRSPPHGAGPLPVPFDPNRIMPGTFLAEIAAVGAAPPPLPVVAAAGMSWRCANGRCTTSALRGSMTVTACRALAERVGAVSYYGLEDRSASLSKGELRECNRGVFSVRATPPRTESGGGLPTSPRPEGAPIWPPPGNAAVPLSPELRAQITNRRALYEVFARRLAEDFARAEAAAQQRERERLERERAMREAARADDSYNTVSGDDCDDNDRYTNPAAPERCDHRDNNCDGVIDEGVFVRAYLDADGDTHGDPATQMNLCPSDLGGTGEGGNQIWVNVGNDCDDADPERWRRDPADPTRCFGQPFGQPFGESPPPPQ
jgi:hypothetical protein